MILDSGKILPHNKLNNHNFEDSYYQEDSRAQSIYVGEQHLAESFAESAIRADKGLDYGTNSDYRNNRVIFVLDVPDDKLIPDEYFTYSKSAWRIVTDGILIGEIKDMLIVQTLNALKAFKTHFVLTQINVKLCNHIIIRFCEIIHTIMRS